LRNIRSALTGTRPIGYLLAALVVLVVSDGLITRFLVRQGLAREGNPLLVPIVGEQSFLAIKVLGALFCALVLWDIYRQRPKLAVASTIGFVALYSGIVLWNLLVFLLGQAVAT
jgi:hypothetical protein